MAAKKSKFIGFKVHEDVFNEYVRKVEEQGLGKSQPLQQFVWSFIDGTNTVLPKRRAERVGDNEKMVNE